MAIKMISVKCPECGATLSLESDRKTAFCTYCGANILVHNDNEITININNEAEVKYAETDQMVNLRKMDLAEKALQNNRNRRKTRGIINLSLLAIGILMIFVGYGLSAFNGGNESLKMLGLFGYFPILGAGFTNVSCIGLGDLAVGLLYKPGKVDSITINGKRISAGGKKYPKDAKVVISYHSHK